MAHPLCAMVLAVLLAGAAAGGTIVAEPAEVRANPSPSPFAAAYEAVAPAVVRVVGTGKYSTGLIVSADGVILTHSDVAGRNELKVYFADGREAKAKVLLRDASTKAAVLQLATAASSSAATSARAASSAQAVRPSWSAAKLGSSKNLTVGSWVATVAYPRGADTKDESEPSLGVGLLVARGSLKTSLSYGGDWLVTDAMMNDASEGGALVDAQGQVVGLLSKPQRNAETNTALNLALPVELAADLIRRARETPDPPMKEEAEKEPPKYGFLGITGVSAAGSYRIAKLVPGGPAEKAGLRVGDVLVSFGRRAIVNYDDLQQALQQTSPGDKIRVTVRRQGEEKEKEIEVTLGKMPKPKK